LDWDISLDLYIKEKYSTIEKYTNNINWYNSFGFMPERGNNGL